MNSIRNILMGSLLSLATILPGLAGAAPQVPERPGVTGDVIDVRVVCDAYGCYDTRRPPPGWRPPPPPGYDRPPSYRPPGWRPPPPPYYPPPVHRPPSPVYRPAPPPVYNVPPGTWRRHVDWCLNRYRSYNPETNRYLSSSGGYRVCRSPYM